MKETEDEQFAFSDRKTTGKHDQNVFDSVLIRGKHQRQFRRKKRAENYKID